MHIISLYSSASNSKLTNGYPAQYFSLTSTSLNLSFLYIAQHAIHCCCSLCMVSLRTVYSSSNLTKWLLMSSFVPSRTLRSCWRLEVICLNACVIFLLILTSSQHSAWNLLPKPWLYLLHTRSTSSPLLLNSFLLLCGDHGLILRSFSTSLYKTDCISLQMFCWEFSLSTCVIILTTL